MWMVHPFNFWFVWGRLAIFVCDTIRLASYRMNRTINGCVFFMWSLHVFIWVFDIMLWQLRRNDDTTKDNKKYKH